MNRKLWLILLCAVAACSAVDQKIIFEGAELITVDGPAAPAANRHPEVLSEQLYKRQERIVDIYNEFYFEDPSVVGLIEVMFTLEADGSVSGCIPLVNETGSAELAKRICDNIMGWSLPHVAEDAYQSWVTVSVPYEFLPTGDEEPVEGETEVDEG